MSVNDMAVAYDGSVIYLISDGRLEKSTNSGNTFSMIPLPYKCVLPLLNVAVAPGDENIIAVSDSRCDGNAFFVSTNGGETWSNIRRPKSGPATITDIAVSPMIVGSIRFYIITVADNRSHRTTLGDVLARKSDASNLAPWKSVGGVQGSHDYMAMQTSPNFPSDFCISVVGARPSGGVDYQIIDIVHESVEQTVNLIPEGTKNFTTYYMPDENSIVSADIALLPEFDAADDSLRLAYVSVTSNNTLSSDGIYRIYDTHVEGVKLNIGVKSVALGDNVLLAGEYNSTRFWRSDNPLGEPTFTPSRPLRPGQWKALVRMGGNHKYLGTGGRDGGFFTI